METAHRQSNAAMAVTGHGMRMAVRTLRDGGDRLSGREPSGGRPGENARMPNGDPTPLMLWGADDAQGQRRL
jgi:hypothetical protein